MNYIVENEETDRLNFRIVYESDFDSFVPLFLEKNVAKFLGMDENTPPKELTEKLFKKCLDRYENNLGGMNILTNKVTNEVIGMCGILVQTIEEEKYLEIGYFILPKFWNQGYASEAAIKCRDYAFKNNYSERLVSLIHKENIGSIKVALNNGMTLFKSELTEPNQDYNLYSIIKEKYNNLTNPRSIQIP